MGLTLGYRQIKDVISSIENQGGIVVQIISLIDEERGIKEIMKKRGFLLSLHSLYQKLKL